MARYQDLCMLGGVPETVDEDAGGRGMKRDLRFLDADEPPMRFAVPRDLE